MTSSPTQTAGFTAQPAGPTTGASKPAAGAAGPQANPGVRVPYRTARPLAPCDLWLAGNEGRPPAPLESVIPSEELGRYPSSASLEAAAAERFGVEPAQVLATAGADDGLLRLALAFLAPGRELILPTPTFEMIPRYAALAGGDVVEVNWAEGNPYPVEAVLRSISPRTSLIAVVSPNNPTGAVACAEDLRRLSEAAPNALLIVDQAYAEFADEDLSAPALKLPNAVVLRTMSKAYGCAGLRVGFSLGAPAILEVLRAAGNPYPLAASSLNAATQRLTDDITPSVQRVRREREALLATLGELGLEASPSQGNFVFVRTPRASQVRDLMAGLGIAIRAFPGVPGLTDALRITLPGDSVDFTRLDRSMRGALAPEAVLFDMDGVLADVSRSYRTAIRETAASYGVTITDTEIEAAKAAGDANDDWRLTWRILVDRGVDCTLDGVTDRFEALYQGTSKAPGLRREETLLLDRATLERLAAARPLAVVTGRPRSDARRFLEEQGIADLFGAVITRDDAPLKPDPEPVRRAMDALGMRTAWMLGDTRDDIESARAAGAVPVAVLPPGGSDDARRTLKAQLCAAGAGVCLDRTTDLEELLP
ncbi:aminotransferase class I/II-fold pyridoxal phosphate-dependent enzyme [Planctomycetota bacterium]|nr:aminotransferase class I/II-fold pyridoxal phosphate-dependent enzyme [Planctomycetota bacterium]